MDIVNEFHRKHRNDQMLLGIGKIYRDPIKAIQCTDGFEISVQASEYSYCSPRVTQDIEYHQFECGFPNAPVPELNKWKDGGDEVDDKETVYGYVPVEVIVKLVESHGGIKQDEETRRGNNAMSNEQKTVKTYQWTQRGAEETANGGFVRLEDYERLEKLLVCSQANFDTLFANTAKLQADNKALREALKGIRLYANDTLSGRVDGPDDREWQRAAVLEIRNRAAAALGATEGT